MLDPLTGPLPDPRSQALYTDAVGAQWSAPTALDWERVSFERVAPPVRLAMGAMYADVLCLESLGVDLLRRMIELSPEGWLRRFAVLQAADEARHVDFFERVVEKLQAEPHQTPELARLQAEVERARDYDELLIHAQTIEAAARIVFVGNGVRTLNLLARGLRLPGSDSVAALLRAVVTLVGRDESRHLAIGLHCLRTRLTDCDALRRQRLETSAHATATLMYSALHRRSRELSRLSWAPDEALDQAWRAMRTQLTRIGLEIGSAPTLVACTR